MLTFGSCPSPILSDPAEKRVESEELESSSSTGKGNSSILSMVTNQFVSEASNIPRRLYCPFCLFDFGFDFLLKTHIRELHHQEIRNFSEAKLDSFALDRCCYCHAKFYVRGLLSKHIVRKHQQCILGIVSVMKPERIVECKFCLYQASMKQLKLLFIHLENKHLNDVVKLLSAYNMNINNAACEAEKDVDVVLQREIQNLNIEKPVEPTDNPKPILKRGSLYNNPEIINALDQDYVSRTRRKLRFDLPDLSVSSESSDKENVSMRQVKNIFQLRPKKSNKLITPNKVNPEPQRTVLQDITVLACEDQTDSDPRFQSFEVLPFKCGVCRQVFKNNALLLSHVKQSHGKLNLQPRYRCGWCKAKFFKNSYLVKHHKLHTKPKCLTSGI